MPDAKVLVLDANILIRAVPGRRVRSLLAQYCGAAQFLVPEAMLGEAEEHLPVILSRAGPSTEEGLAVLREVCKVVQVSKKLHTQTLRRLPGYVSRRVTRMIGRFSPPPVLSNVPSGPKMPISSAPA